jgi:hypothetical protein
LALSLVDGYRILRDSGIVILNPQGDGPWDGRPLPIGRSLAWLGLHSAAPVVMAICSIGAYEIWPRWQVWPSLRGRVVLRIGKPFKLVDLPQEEVNDEDLARATACIAAKYDELCYGPGGIKAWIGSPLQRGRPTEQPVQLHSASKPTLLSRVDRKRKPPVWLRGIPLLLWRCPICHTDDALVHQRPWFRTEILSCRACNTRWEIQRLIGKDFRLKVVAGPPDLVGLEMALSSWYDEMKKDFQPVPVPISGLALLPDEEVYLETGSVSLLVHQPSALLKNWPNREPPQAPLPGQPQLADWAKVGKGQLFLTSHRLLWRGPDRELDFKWSSITAVFLWFLKTIGIRYGTARYRFGLGQEVGLKWLTYAGTLAHQSAERDGHKIITSPF